MALHISTSNFRPAFESHQFTRLGQRSMVQKVTYMKEKPTCRDSYNRMWWNGDVWALAFTN